MTIIEAFEILGLEISSSEEEIKKKHKELAKKYHTDKGREQDDEMMKRLNEAKTIAISFQENKHIYTLAISHVKDIILFDKKSEEKKQELKSEADILLLKLNKWPAHYKKLKNTGLIVGTITGIFTLLVSNILPIYQLNAGETASKIPTYFVLMYGAVFGILYLYVSNLQNKVKENIELFKQALDNKKVITKLLIEILLFDKSHFAEKFNENDFVQQASRWLGLEQEKLFTYIFVPSFGAINSYNKDIRSVAKFMAQDDFIQLLLLKSQEKGLINEIEIDISNELSIYIITEETKTQITKYIKQNFSNQDGNKQ